LAEPQVKISKHLGYLKSRGLVEATRDGNWIIYRLPRKPSPELRANLACLHDCASEEAAFRRDAVKLAKVRSRLSKTDCPCAVRNA
jgi:ArsR family transcriptional regulator